MTARLFACAALLSLTSAALAAPPPALPPQSVQIAAADSDDYAARYLGQRVTLQLDGVTLRLALERLADAGGMRLAFGTRAVAADRRVSLDVQNVPLSEALRQALRGTGLGATSTRSGTLVVAPGVVSELHAEVRLVDYAVSGRVVAAQDGEALAGVNVRVVGTLTGTVTDADGRYALQVPDDARELRFSFIGFREQTVALDGPGTYDVALELQIDVLDETVVIGYGTAQRRSVTGSISSIDAEQLERLPPILNPVQALEGLAAGVQVVQANGQPGTTPRVRIRGATSLLGSNEPLYVVDGVPIVDGGGFVFDAATRAASGNLNEQLNELGVAGPLAGLPASDIVSIDILKDASAAAIYGSRAANGVVLITTRRGRVGEKPTFTFGYGLTTQTAIRADLLDGDEYRMLITEAAEANPTQSTARRVLDINMPFFGDANTDWFDEVAPDGPLTHSFDLSARGGTQTVRYLASFSAMNQQGVLDGSGLDRYNGRLNFNAELSPRAEFATTLNLNYARTLVSDPSLTRRIYTYRPDVPVVNTSDGTFANAPNSVFENPVALTNASNDTGVYGLTGSATGSYAITPALRLAATVQLAYTDTRKDSFYPGYTQRGNNSLDGAGGGFASEETRTNLHHLVNTTLTYDERFGLLHGLTGVVGAEWEGRERDYLVASAEDFPDERVLINIRSGATQLFSNSYRDGAGAVGYFGRLAYDYDARYLLSVSGRVDESTVFAPGNKRGFFPTAAAGWRVSEEAFLDGVGWLSDFKLRGSVGVTGRQPDQFYAWRSLYRADAYGGAPAVLPIQIGNRDLRWERTTQYDAGLDFALFDYRLTGTLGYYVKDTDDVLYSNALASSTGFGGGIANIGSIRNEGVEFDLSGRFELGRRVEMQIGGNISTNRSTLTRLNTTDFDPDLDVIRVSGGAFLREGDPLGLHVGYVSDGIFQTQDEIDALNAAAPGAFYQRSGTAPGDIRFRDLDGDGDVDSDDQTVIGNAQADFTGGFSAALDWNGLEISSLFTFAYGADLLWLGERELALVQTSANNLGQQALDRWTAENPSDRPRAVLGDPNINGRISDFFIYDGSYLRLTNLNLSYAVPAALTQRLGARMQVFGTAYNVLTWTRYPGPDPANAVINAGNSLRLGIDFSRYPLARSYSLGARITF